jgi:hypothetical protein
MTDKEQALVGQFLKAFSDRLGNDCCNDWNFPDDWTHEEKVEFCRAYHDWNGDPEEFNPDHLHLPDFAVAEFLASRF